LKAAANRALLLFAVLAIGSLPALAQSTDQPRKRSKSDRDINAIGHRKVARDQNWYSLDKEKQLGEQFSAAFERAVPMLQDQATSAYLDALTQRIAQNSDTQVPVSVRVVNSDRVSAETLAGGHVYITRGLLAQMASEGELASVLAREVAHTAIRSATATRTRENLAQLVRAPFGAGQDEPGSKPAAEGIGFAIPWTVLSFRRALESDADYFGIQYLYKSGYDAECFLTAIQKVIPSNSSSTFAGSFRSFPPLAHRLAALRKEIAKILPRREGARVSGPEFSAFQEHLHILRPPDPEPTFPKLIRHDQSSTPDPPSI
jgi:predicted Zn-dependent protease